jgi:HK97 gp10 family phage protein
MAGFKIDVKVSGLAVFIRNKDEWVKKKRKQLIQALTESALLVQNEARQSILKGPKTGRLYIRRGRIRHRASAPGEPPASDTGTLARSIVIDVDTRAFTATVGSNVKYAPYLELGTSRMRARPFLSRALQLKRSQIVKVIQARLRS